jgi:hypothetical protein
MSRIFLLRLALLSSAVMMACLSTSAAATFSSSSQTLRATWARLSFQDPFGNTLVCPITLEGSFHNRTFVKGIYNLVGNITRALIGPREQCVGGEATILTETLPWNMRYQSFTGTLPNITSIRFLIANASIRWHSNALGATCLFTSRETLAEHLSFTLSREAGGGLTSATTAGEITSNEACALGARVRERLTGTSTSLTVLNSTTKITVTLI